MQHKPNCANGTQRVIDHGIGANPRYTPQWNSCDCPAPTEEPFCTWCGKTESHGDCRPAPTENRESVDDCDSRTPEERERDRLVKEVEGKRYIITKSYGRRTSNSPFMTVGERKSYNQALEDVINLIKGAKENSRN